MGTPMDRRTALGEAEVTRGDFFSAQVPEDPCPERTGRERVLDFVLIGPEQSQQDDRAGPQGRRGRSFVFDSFDPGVGAEQPAGHLELGQPGQGYPLELLGTDGHRKRVT